ncbi:MAG: T9SS type A sorting domain-containing protein [Prevotella sp.]|nr:T9SS type A sorting domain-containing protein [Prevotella sp.]
MSKKFLLISAILLTASFSHLSAAEQDTIPGTVFGVQSVKLDGYDSSFYGIFRVSNNGKYAVASDTSDSYAGILWERESNSITYVNNYTGEKANGVILNDVSNDGMMVGDYPAPTESSFCWQPGYKYPDKDWVELPLPENTNLKYPTDIDYCSQAIRVSSDGRVVLGEVYLYYTETKSHWEPMLWFLDEEGNVTGTQTFEDLEYGNQGFQGYDMSDDGSVIVGMMTSARGDMLPTVIQDGVMRWLDGPELTWNESENRWLEYDENGVMKEYYWEGMANCIDKDGNVYYYYSNGDGVQHNVVENIYTGEKREYDKIVSCGVGSLVLGMTVVASDRPIDMSALYSAINVSDDGTVIAGGGLGVESYGSYFNYPALIVLDESPIETSIKAMKLDGINISRNGNTISISGDFDRAEMFNATGMQVASSKGDIDLNSMTNGMYIIRVSKGNATNVYKILK